MSKIDYPKRDAERAWERQDELEERRKARQEAARRSRRSPARLGLGTKALIGAGMFTGILGTGMAVANTLSGNGGKPPKLPTVAEYDAHPDQYPGFQSITLEPGAAPQGLAKEYMPGTDVKLGGDAILEEHAENGYGEAPLQQNEELIVPKTTDQQGK